MKIPGQISVKINKPIAHRCFAASSSRTGLTSAAFWGLMDRWKIPDIAALNMIAHRGGLSKKGTRPRFKLLEPEARLVSLLFEINQTLENLGLDPETWVNEPVKVAPFGAATPASYLTQNGVKGTQEISRYLLRNGLKRSMSD